MHNVYNKTILVYFLLYIHMFTIYLLQKSIDYHENIEEQG